MKGIIFDIKKFAVHDGPGIRSTVFFKGCPLRCLLVPQSRRHFASPGDHGLFQPLPARAAATASPSARKRPWTSAAAAIVLDRGRCDGCGACAAACPAEALQAAGRKVERRRGHGRTGQRRPFLPGLGRRRHLFRRRAPAAARFSAGAAGRLPRRKDLHTAVDTCGQAPFADFAKILPLVDLFLFDLKIMDDGRHRRLTGVSNRLLLENLANALSRRARPWPSASRWSPAATIRRRDLEQTGRLLRRPAPAATRSTFSPITAAAAAKASAWAATIRCRPPGRPTAAGVQRARKYSCNANLTVTIGG